MEPLNSEGKPPFAQWCVVEVMGHHSVAGYVTEEVVFGTALVRIDVPEIPERRYTRRSWSGEPSSEVVEPPIAAHTVYYGPGSLYSLKPTTEEAARARARQLRVKSIDVYLPTDDTQEIPLSRALPPGDDCDEDDTMLDYEELRRA
jgi:hypothetical protein